MTRGRRKDVLHRKVNFRFRPQYSRKERGREKEKERERKREGEREID